MPLLTLPSIDPTAPRQYALLIVQRIDVLMTVVRTDTNAVTPTDTAALADGLWGYDSDNDPCTAKACQQTLNSVVKFVRKLDPQWVAGQLPTGRDLQAILQAMH